MQNVKECDKHMISFQYFVYLTIQKKKKENHRTKYCIQ